MAFEEDKDPRIDPRTGVPSYYNINKPNLGKINWSDISQYRKITAPITEQTGLEYAPYGGIKDIDERVSPLYYDDIEEGRAQAQSGWELAGKAIGQAATELTLGTVEGAGYLLDAPSTIYNLINGQEQDFDNWWSKGVREAKEGINDAWFPIYQSEAAKNGNMFDPTSLASNFSSLATTVALMVPAAGAARGMAAALGRFSKISAKGLKMAEAITAGVASRAAEATMEARGFAEQYGQQWRQEAESKYMPQAMAEINALPLAMPISPENPNAYSIEQRNADAKAIADKYKSIIDKEVSEKVTDGAAKVFMGNSVLAGVDGFQYAGLLNVFSSPTKKLAGKLIQFGWQAATEGAEEAYQTGLQLEAAYSEKEGGKFLGPGFSERVGEYLHDSDLQTAALWGAVGGGVFEAAGPLFRKTVEAGEQLKAGWNTAKIKDDLVGKKKIEDSVITDVIIHNSRRNNLDNFASTMETFATGIDDEYLKENGTTKEEMDSRLKRIQDDINFVKAEQASLETNPVFSGKPELQLRFIKTQLDSRNNLETIAVGKKQIEEIYDNLLKTNQIDSDTKSLKDFKSLYEALVNLRKNINKIPSFKNDSEARDRAIKKLDAQINLAKATYESYRDSYKERNNITDISAKETTAVDHKLTEAYNKTTELQFVEDNVNKQKIATFNTLKDIAAKAEEERLQEERRAAAEKQAAEQAKTASTPDDVKTATNTATVTSPEAVTATNTIQTNKATEQEKTAPVDPTTRYEGRPELFNKEVSELNSEINSALVKAGLPPLNILKNSKTGNYVTEQEFKDTIVLIATDKAGFSPEGSAAVKAAIKQYYKGKATVKTIDTKATVNPTSGTPTQPVETEESNINYTSPADTNVRDENLVSRSIITQYKAKVVNGVLVYERDKNGELIPFELASDVLGFTQNDWDYINSKAALEIGSEIEFVVDMNMVKFNPNEYNKKHKFGSKEFIASFTILIIQNGHLVGAVRPTTTNTTTFALREAIFNNIKDSKETRIISSGITTKVTYKFNGNLNTKKGLKNKPKNVVKEGVTPRYGVAVKLANSNDVVIKIDDTTTIKVPEKYNGNVFLLIEGANGTIIPALVFTEKVRTVEKYKTEALRLLGLFNKDNKDVSTTKKQLKSVVGINDFTYNPSDDSFWVKDGPKTKKQLSREQFTEMVLEAQIQVDRTKINSSTRGSKDKLTYAERLNNDGVFRTNIVSGAPVIDANFEFDIVNYKTTEQKATEATPIVEVKPDVEESLVKESTEEKPVVTESLGSQESVKPESKQDDSDITTVKRRTKGKTIKVNIDLSNDRNKQSTEEFYQKWNAAEETQWFKDKFGELTYEQRFRIQQGLLNINNSGGLRAWGQFKQAMVIISSVAKVGTTYHEAFHLTFHLFLSDAQQKAVLKEGSKKYNIDINDTIAIEEAMADDFMEYVLSQEGTATSRFSKILDFFKDLYYMIKSRLTTELTINQLFNNIQRGKYKDAGIIRDVSKFDVERNKVMSAQEDLRRVDTISHKMTQVLDAVIAENPEYKSLTRREILNSLFIENEDGSKSFGLEIIMDSAFNNLYDDYQLKKEAGLLDANQEKAYATMLNNFMKEDENGNTIKGEYYKKALSKFAYNEGISFSVDETVALSFTDSSMEEGEVLMANDEQDSKLEGWQIKAESMSAKESLSKEVRRELSYIPKLNNDGTPQIDDLGYTIYHNFDYVFATLIRELSGVMNSDEMLEKLALIATEKPYLKGLVTKLSSDSLLKTAMFNAFAKFHREYTVVVEERKSLFIAGRWEIFTKFKLVTSNRNNIKNIVVDELKIDSLDPYANKILNKDGSVDKKKAAAIKKEFESLTNSFNIKQHDGKHTSSEITKIANKLKEAGLNISVQDITNIMRPTKERVDGKLVDVTPEQNVVKLFNQIKQLLSVYAAGNNPFATETIETQAINKIGEIVGKVRFEVLESSFRNSEGNTVYSHQIPNFLSKNIQRFKNDPKGFVEWYKSTPFYEESPWLAELADESMIKEFSIVELDGFRAWNKDKGTTYTKMSEKDFELVSTNMFFNNGSDEYAYYRLPVTSDAPKMLFVKFKKFNIEGDIHEEGVIDKLYSVFKQELARMANIKSRLEERKAITEGQEIPDNLKKIEFYDVDNAADAEKFLLLSNEALQGVDYTNENAVKAAITGWLETERVKDFKRLTDLGVFGKSYLSDSRIKNPEVFHKEYFYNSVLANTQMTTLFSGDPAFYKKDKGLYTRTIDYQKRNKQIISPANMIDTTASYKLRPEEAIGVDEGKTELGVRASFRSITLRDFNATGDVEAIAQALISGGMSEKDAYDVASNYGNNKINVTDAQSYITLPRYREIMVGLRRWTAKHQNIYSKVLDGTATAKDIAFIMQPIKPFYFGHMKLHDQDNLIRPYQVKNSEYLLIPQLVNKSPELKKLYEFMMTNDISQVNFESAVKVGGSGIVSSDLNSLDKATIFELNNSDWGLQQETPEHYIDTTNLYGSQIRKLILSDISPDAEFKLPFRDKLYSRQELIDLYQDIIVQDLKEAYEETEKEFLDDNGKISNEKLYNLLIDEVRSRNLGEDFENAIKLVPRKNPVTHQVEMVFNLPLFHPLHAKRIESLLNSIFKNRVTKQKIKGGAFVQLSSFGYSDSLELKITDGRLEYAEVMLPWWSKEYFEPVIGKDGQLDVKKIPPELLELVGYRIPTEDKYSMLPLRVKGFLPAVAGGAIMLPKEITTISGSDFDIDKMYVMMPEFRIKKYDINKAKSEFERVNKLSKALVDKVVEQGENDEVTDDEVFNEWWNVNKDNYLLETPRISKIKYDSSKAIAENSKKARNNAKIDIIRSVLTHPDTFSKLIKPGGFDTLKSLAGTILQLEGKDKEILNISLPGTQAELFKRNMAGVALKGIFANHNAHHAVLQHTDVALTMPVVLNFVKGDETIDEEFTMLNGVRDYTNTNFISRNVAEFLAASVDNAKDPVLGFLNINTYTANTAALLARLGLPLDVVTHILSQPILKVLSDKYYNMGNERKALNYLYATRNKKFKNGIEGVAKTDIASLKDNIKNKDAFTEQQFLILDLFLSIKESADSLNSLVQANRSDTVGAGPTLAANEKLIEARSRIKRNAGLTGVQALLSGDVYPMLAAFDKYGIDLPTELLSEIFPWRRTAFKNAKTDIFNAMSPSAVEMLTEKDLEEINYELLGYIATGFGYYADTDEIRDFVINKFPEHFRKTKEANLEFFRSNPFLNKFVVEQPKDSKLLRISFKNTGSINKEEQHLIREAWKDLMEDSKFTKLAIGLAKYTFYTAGFKFTPHSFSHMLPVDFYTSKSMISSANVTFNDFLSMEFENMNNPVYETMYESFRNLFLRNHYTDYKYVPQLDKDGISGELGKIKGTPVCFVLDLTDPKVGNILTYNQGVPVMPEFISHEVGDKTFLFKKDAVTYGDGSMPHLVGYIVTEPLGMDNVSLEYSKDVNTRSIHPENRIYERVAIKDVRNMLYSKMGIDPASNKARVKQPVLPTEQKPVQQKLEFDLSSTIPQEEIDDVLNATAPDVDVLNSGVNLVSLENEFFNKTNNDLNTLGLSDEQIVKLTTKEKGKEINKNCNE